MSAYVHTGNPGAEPEFACYLTRDETRAITLHTPDIPIGKLALVHCMGDNSETRIYEYDFPIELKENDDDFKAYIRNILEELDPNKPTKTVSDMQDGVTLSIGNEELGFLSATVRHSSVYGDIDFLNRQSWELMSRPGGGAV